MGRIQIDKHLLIRQLKIGFEAFSGTSPDYSLVNNWGMFLDEVQPFLESVNFLEDGTYNYRRSDVQMIESIMERYNGVQISLEGVDSSLDYIAQIVKRNVDAQLPEGMSYKEVPNDSFVVRISPSSMGLNMLGLELLQMFAKKTFDLYSVKDCVIVEVYFNNNFFEKIEDYRQKQELRKEVAGQKSMYTRERRNTNAKSTTSQAYSQPPPKEQSKKSKLDEDYKANSYGIDISHYQGVINWEKALESKLEGKRKLQMVFIKASEGLNIKDGRFVKYWEAISSKDQIKYKAAYHYYRLDDDPIQQAKNMSQVLEGVSFGNSYVVLDFEDEMSKNFPIDPPRKDRKKQQEKLVKQLLSFFNQLSAKGYTNQIIYTRTNYWNTMVGDSGNVLWSGRGLWLSRYPAGSVEIGSQKLPDEIEKGPRDLPTGADKPTFWQFSDKGKVDGITGWVDLDLISNNLF